MINFYSAYTRDMTRWQRFLARSIIFTFTTKKGLSFAIKYYTQLWKPNRMDIHDIPSHISKGKQPVNSTFIIFQSQIVQHLSEWDNPHYSFVYYKDGELFYDADIFWEHVRANENKPYAFMQLLFFVWRYLMKKYFKMEVKKNWFTSNQVCSEHAYNDMRDHHAKHKIFKFTILKLLKYNSNTFAPMDCYNVCEVAQQFGEGKWVHYQTKEI